MYFELLLCDVFQVIYVYGLFVPIESARLYNPVSGCTCLHICVLAVSQLLRLLEVVKDGPHGRNRVKLGVPRQCHVAWRYGSAYASRDRAAPWVALAPSLPSSNHRLYANHHTAASGTHHIHPPFFLICECLLVVNLSKCVASPKGEALLCDPQKVFWLDVYFLPWDSYLF